MNIINAIKRNFAEFFLLFIIVAIGIIIYFTKLGEIPSGFYIDEALPGYNAYSLLLTGRDEYGKFLPFVLRFYGSYNPPFYTYATVIPIALWGLNVFSVRFMSSLLGLLSFIPFYFLIKKSGVIKSKWSGLVGSLLMVISPWLILHSRVGYEVSSGFFFLAFGVMFAWLSLKNYKMFYPGVLLLSLATYAAYTERFIVPIFILLFLFLFRKELLAMAGGKYVKKGIVLFIISQIPNIALLATPAFFPKSNLFGSDIVINQARKITEYLPMPISIGLAFIREFLSQYVDYFSPKSLFFIPDPDIQRSIPELSTLYTWMLIPFLLGIYFLWKNKNKSFAHLVFLMCVVFPIPAALTRDPFATHRALPLLLPIIIIICLGMDLVISKSKTFVWLPIFIVLIIFSIALLYRSYYVLLPKERDRAWGYGVKELSEELQKNSDAHYIIDESRTKNLYINIAFFMKYPPSDFQKANISKVSGGYYHTLDFDPYYKFANLETRKINWQEDIYRKQILVGDEYAVSEKQASEHFLTKVFEIKDYFEVIIFRGYETNPVLKCKSDPKNYHCKSILEGSAK